MLTCQLRDICCYPSCFANIEYLFFLFMQINAKDEKDVTPLELLILHSNRGLMHHKPRLEELKRMEDMHDMVMRCDIDMEAVKCDETYQKQVTSQ